MIFYNAIRTPDGTVIVSKYGHDFVCHKDANGYEYCVDGGNNYLRRIVSTNAPDYWDISMDTKDFGHDTVRKFLSWGTRGKDGVLPIRYVPIEFLDTDHIEAILATQHQIYEELRTIFINELEYRKTHD